MSRIKTVVLSCIGGIVVVGAVIVWQLPKLITASYGITVYKGVVVDADDGTPLERVHVEVHYTEYTGWGISWDGYFMGQRVRKKTDTDAEGRFELAVPGFDHSITFYGSSICYDTIKLFPHEIPDPGNMIVRLKRGLR